MTNDIKEINNACFNNYILINNIYLLYYNIYLLITLENSRQVLQKKLVWKCR